MNTDRLQKLEEQFWNGDANFYRANVADDALFVVYVERNGSPLLILHQQTPPAG